MLDSTKLCLISTFRRAKKLIEKLNTSKKLRTSWNMQASDISCLPSSFASMEVSAQLKQVFKIIDENGDGKLSPLELKKVLLSMGHEKAEAAKEAEGIVREMDFNGDGFVDMDEFVITVMGLNDRNEDSIESEVVMRAAFRVFDADNNGLISAKELQSVIGRVGIGKCSISECTKMIRGVDRDGDGFVNFDEFMFMMSGRS